MRHPAMNTSTAKARIARLFPIDVDIAAPGPLPEKNRDPGPQSQNAKNNDISLTF